MSRILQEHSNPRTDDHITHPQHDITSLPAPRTEHPSCFQELAEAPSGHFNPPDRREDLDQTLHHVIAGETSRGPSPSPSPSPAPPPDPSCIQELIDLPSVLIHRLKESKEPELEDVNAGIEHLRRLLDHPLEAFNVPSRHRIKMCLAQLLAARVNLKPEVGVVLEDSNEVMALCRELPPTSPDVSPSYIAGVSKALTRKVLTSESWYYPLGHDTPGPDQVQLLSQTIGFLREALKTCPLASGFHAVSLDLANLLAVRFLTFHRDDDYEEAIQVLHTIKITDSPSPWARDRKDVCGNHDLAAKSLESALEKARSILRSNVEDSEDAISRCLSFISGSSDFGDPINPLVLKLLKHLADGLSEHSEHREGTLQAHSRVDLSFGLVEEGVGGHGIIQTASSLLEVEEKIKGLRQQLSPVGTDGRKDALNDLVRWYNVKIQQTKNVGDIKEAIKCHQMLLDLVSSRDQSRFCYLSAFSNLLFLAYQRTKIPEYLHESIIRHYEVLQLESAKLIHFVTTQRLISLLSIRRQLSDRKSECDLDEIMNRFKSGVTDTHAMATPRFELACQWAYYARLCGHSSLRSAYQSAMSLMQDSLVFGPTLIIQHNRLVEKRDLFEKTPLNFASHQIRVEQVEDAVETLEQGRALLWSEMRGFRTSTDRLRAECPALGDKFTKVNSELEMLATSTSSSRNVGIDDWGTQPHGSEGQLHRLMVKQEDLLKRRVELISQIRCLPNFIDFLKPPSFDTLRSAAAQGVVIIITHCKWRSDIIIVLRDSPPSLIPTSYKFFARANCLKDKLLTTRKNYGLEHERYADALRSVLADLYELVGQHVIKRLKELRIPEQSRVWWCPTSVFGYLPLHAMGPIPSNGTSTYPQYFSDLFISSYTSTLSALIASRNLSPPTPAALPNLLDVQPYTPARAHTQEIQDLGLQVTCLTPGNVILTTLPDELSCHRVVDIGYNGVLKEGEPFDTALKFHDKDCLTILDVVRLRLSTCEFAFLPGSHTAELTQGSIPDEALHIAAAMQHSGFRSVIGSMWETVDGDGQTLAKDVYLSMFSGDDREVPYYERSARALRDAVRRMRERGVSLVQWVNFVHFGV